MRAPGHKLTGLSAGVIAWTLLAGYTPLAWLAIPAGFIGGGAPDRIEWLWHHRWITHRTLTHWLPLWMALLGVGIWHDTTLWAAPLIGFAAGGLTHLLFDLPNPLGVPILSPVHRLSLRWWNSGEHDGLLTLACIVLAAATVWMKTHGGG